MSIAEKLTTIAENEQRVYEAGKTAEYDRFWDIFQNNGARKSYNATWRGKGWNRDVYNPKYPILATDTESLFANGSWLKDTLVSIDTTGTLDYAFSWCTELATIRYLKVTKTVKFTNAFTGCSKLQNVVFDGQIGQNISFADCTKLTKESLLSIIEHLYDFVKTGEGGTHTCTLGTTNLAKLTDTEKAIAQGKGWTLA